MLLPVIVCLFIAAIAHGSNTSTSIAFPHTFASNTSTSSANQPHASTSNATSNATVFAPLAAPIYRNVTAGDAWVFPSSANDLGARAMACECFSPDDQCCMPGSPSVAPFCIPSGSTCCGDTFCNAGESCCGAGCCAANTTCNIKLAGSGCCPIGEICSGPLNCYDSASSNCSNEAVPLPQCCPADTPFCRDFNPGGLGCYAFSTTASPISSLPAMTAAGTSDLFAVPFQTSTSMGAAHTVTISVVSKGDGEFSLEFPTNTAPIGSGEGTSTTYVLEWPAASSTAAVALMGSPSAASSTTPIVSSTATATTTTTSSSTTTTQAAVASSSTSISSSSSTISPLCYDPNANSHSPCPTTTTSPASASASASASSSAGGFHPPGAKIVSSQAGKPLRVPFLDAFRDFFALFPASFQTDDETILLLSAIAAIACLIGAYAYFIAAIAYCRNQLQQPHVNTTSTTDIANVEHDDTTTTTTVVDMLKDMHDSESGGGAKHAITVVKGSARPLLEPRVVEKGEIQVMEGSARPFVKGKRTHSLWEGMGGGAEDGGGGVEEVGGEMGEGEGEA